LVLASSFSVTCVLKTTVIVMSGNVLGRIQALRIGTP